jgi:hypothetical protein
MLPRVSVGGYVNAVSAGTLMLPRVLVCGYVIAASGLSWLVR